MVNAITFNQTHIAKEELEKQFGEKVQHIHKQMVEGTSIGAEFLGWKQLPNEIDQEELNQVLATAEKLRKSADVVVVIGVGGSYLGAKAVQDALSPYFGKNEDNPEVIFAGQNLSGTYMKQLLQHIEGKEVAVIVISKSGTTTEPAIAFRILLEYMENRYGAAMKDRVVAITDKSKGALRELANRSGFTTFVVPDDVGGRFSVLTPVGLLPIAVAGIDILQLLEGAKDAVQEYNSSELSTNSAYQYAALRNHLLNEGYNIEILASFTPNFATFHEWWKQLFGESEGKDGKGIYPASVAYPTDLHSLGQYVQDGRREIFETFVQFKETTADCAIPTTEDNLDGLNYLSDKTMNEINDVTLQATMEAHQDGGVPLIHLTVGKKDAYHIGYIIYFFEMACAMSAYLLGVNPFDQPGVEEYKKNIFRMLEKPGFVEEN
ncbi:glucose-6-phosphate isomerase [Sporosarcina ureilytica]|uniref:Glucose-6-phosphate isomerase n=1 Tax=Sporosarcina ureilytica TaxID=298596 RepID=A0A1D8JIR3_9BACL|nr:glucose-6-phosphate isomerase [Sporosarcina ureilytica]AOV08590.1 glucose-6-phosphate isomerase [Sporosarcina ureilytica]